jgi:transcriptional regulator NrdR family protein
MPSETKPEPKAERWGLTCPCCGGTDWRVVYTRGLARGAIRRRRECKQCGKRVTTIEKRTG